MVVPRNVAKNHGFKIYTKDKTHRVEMTYSIERKQKMTIKMIAIDGLEFRVIIDFSKNDNIKIRLFTDRTLIHSSESHLLKIWGLEINSDNKFARITSDMVTTSNCSLRLYSCTENIYKYNEVMSEYSIL
jgi:hypothetical protein